MKPQDSQSPDLTAFVLGESTAQEAAQVRDYLARTPEAKADLERIQQMVGALKQAPPIPVRALHPHQRETILAMTRPVTVSSSSSAKRAKVVPFKRSVPAVKYARPAGSMAWTISKYGVAAAFIVGAFVLGQHTPANLGGLASTGEDAAEVKSPGEEPIHALAAVALPRETTELVPALKKPILMTVAAAVPGGKQFELPAKTFKAMAQVLHRPAAPVPAPTPTVAAVPSLKGFLSTASSTESRLLITPKLLRRPPVPREFAGVILASPQSPNAKPEAPRKPEPQPALTIHSWKVEIASCPWDPSRRLMRFVAQVPVDQNGVLHQEQDYKFVAKFDPFHVQGFRLVSEKHMPPAPSGTQATRFAWYEIVPNRNFNASQDRPVTLGTIQIDQPRGAHASPDLAPLKIVDRGLGWANTREDFAFETAMVGWSLLLQGTENTGGLNHKLVLDLAEQNSGEDSNGERAKFISTVKQAQRSVGL